MVQLHGNFCAMRMDARAQFREARQEFIIGNGGLLPRDSADRPGNPGNPGNDQPRPAFGLFFMIGDQAFAHRAVFFRQADAHRSHHDAILNLHLIDATG